MSEEGTRILNDAIDILNEKGHCKGVIEDEEGRVCAMGALSLAATRRRGSESFPLAEEIKVFYNARDRLNSEVTRVFGRDAFGSCVNNISLWNDANSTSTEDVILAFKRAAADE